MPEENQTDSANKLALLTPAKAARICGISPSTWHRWEAQGVTPKPVIRRGRIVRFARADIERFMETLQGGAA